MSAVSPERTIRLSSTEQEPHHPNHGEHSYHPSNTTATTAFPNISNTLASSSAHQNNAENQLRAPLSQQTQPASSSMEEIPMDPITSTRGLLPDPTYSSSVPAAGMSTFNRTETTTNPPPAYHSYQPSDNPSFSSQPPQSPNPYYHPPSTTTTPYNHYSNFVAYPHDPPTSTTGTFLPTPAPSPMFAAAITAGGILGLTAAAAVRWLNGGDFTLWPPATMNGHPILEQSEAEKEDDDWDTPRFLSQQQQQQNNNAAWEEAQQSTLKVLQTLQDTVQAQAQQQDLLWERWQGNCNSNREEDEVHRPNNHDHSRSTTTTDILDTLRSIHSELVVLRRHEKYEKRLAITLDKLDELLETISTEQRRYNDNSDPEPSATTTTIELPGQPSQPQQPAVAKNQQDHHQPLAQAIYTLVHENTGLATRTGAQLLYLYCVNVSSHPRIPRYRKIFSTNESYQTHVATLTGAHALLEAVGFVPVYQSNHHDNNGAKTTTTTADVPDYWEWFPPSIHKKGGEDDIGSANDTKNSGVAMSPKQAWFGDSEEFYLQRLKMAAAALSLIKSPTFGQDSNDPSELWELLGVDPASLSTSLGAPPPSAVVPPVSNHSSFSAGEELSVTTPDRSGLSFADDTPAEMNFTPTITKGYPPRAGNHIFETPDTGSVLSPPTTKKQLSLNSDFPLLVDDDPLRLRQDPEVLLSQPSLNVLREGDSCETSEVSFGGVAADSGSAEAALWK